MIKLNGDPNINANEHLKIIEDKIDKATDEEFIEVMQQIISKD